MAEEGYGEQNVVADINTRIRDIEDKEHILKERVLLIGNSFIKEREKMNIILKEMQFTLTKLVDEQTRMQEVLKNSTEQIGKLARREEVQTIQRQLELLRGGN